MTKDEAIERAHANCDDCISALELMRESFGTTWIHVSEVRELLIEQFKRGRIAAGPRGDMSHAESSTDSLLRDHGIDR